MDNGDGTYKVDPAISMTFVMTAVILQLVNPCSSDFALLGNNMEIKSEDWNVF